MTHTHTHTRKSGVEEGGVREGSFVKSEDICVEKRKKKDPWMPPGWLFYMVTFHLPDSEEVRSHMTARPSPSAPSLSVRQSSGGRNSYSNNIQWV